MQIIVEMDECEQTAGEHIQDLLSCLYRYHRDSFLCDVIILVAGGHEILVHSIVLATVCMHCCYMTLTAENEIEVIT